METIKDVLMRRDNLTDEEAQNLIEEAAGQLEEYLLEGDQDAAYHICEEYFGLEPDYIMDLMELI